MLSASLPGVLPGLAAAATAAQSAASSVSFLAAMQDEFHTRLPVYDDVSSAGNHFVVFAKIGYLDGQTPVEVNGSWPTNPHSGATCIRFRFAPPPGPAWGGYYMLNGTLSGTVPEPNFGTVPNAGISLVGATRLKFWARGEQGGEQVKFFVGGVGRVAATGAPNSPYPDSSPVRELQVTLTSAWTRYEIDVSTMNLSYVLGGFGWSSADRSLVFYVDDIEYELGPAAQSQRLAQPRFLRSYLTAPRQPNLADPTRNKDGDFDLVLRNSAYAYDNALALLAFLADGSADSLRRARLVGDAFIYALEHDRFHPNDRVRSNYAAGDIALPPGWSAGGKTGTVPVAGYYDEVRGVFFEIGQDAIDTGNNAWTLIALAALHQRTGDTRYRDAALRIGGFIRRQYSAAGTYPGFLGGIDAPEGTPRQRGYASVEHNLDVAAAFMLLAAATGDASWRDDAHKARSFVAALRDPVTGCYLSGTVNPDTRNLNPYQLPVDVQAWAVLSPGGAPPSRRADALDCAGGRHLVAADGFVGVDFNNDRDGVWFEGTAHVATAARLAGRLQAAEMFKATLRAAQEAAGFGDGAGLPAASHDGVTTGFNADAAGPGGCTTDPRTCTFKLFKRRHIGATSWNVYAQKDYNPYTARTIAPAPSRLGGQQDHDGDGRGDLLVRHVTTGTSALWRMAGSSIDTRTTLLDVAAWRITAAPDLDGDGRADLLWTNDASGETAAWLSDGQVPRPGAVLLTHPGWRVVQSADFDGDGRADLLWHNAATGETSIWLMDGLAAKSRAAVLTDPAWAPVAVADLDGDGRADILWRNAGTGATAVWLMDGTRPRVSEVLLVDPDWSLLATPDLDGDGRADLLWVHGPTRRVAGWLMDGATRRAAQILLADPAWEVRTTADLDGDGRDDVLWVHRTTGVSALWLMDGLAVRSSTLLYAPAGWQIVGTPDLNGDGRADLVWFNPALDNLCAVWLMDGAVALERTVLAGSSGWRPPDR